MPVTQADVARRAGVSRRTVSNVVNKFPDVSADVVARVTAPAGSFVTVSPRAGASA